jgi:hypothetical protein
MKSSAQSGGDRDQQRSAGIEQYRFQRRTPARRLACAARRDDQICSNSIATRPLQHMEFGAELFAT